MRNTSEVFVWFTTSLIAITILAFDSFGADVSVKYVGPYQGTLDGTPFSTSLIISVGQSANSVVGVFANGLGSSGSLRGTVVGNTIIPLTGSDSNGCSFSGSATLSADHLIGTLSVRNNGRCAGIDAAFDLTKQISTQMPPTGSATVG